MVLGGIYMGVGALIAALAAVRALDLYGKDFSPFAGLLLLLFAAFIAYPGFKQFRRGREYRQLFASVDETGLWVHNTVGRNVIRWDTLAAVALHWSKADNQAGKDYSIELCPTVPVDRDDPIMRGLVRDEEPLRPDLPRLRYRIVANGPFREPMIDAIRQYAPQLWLGETEREPDYFGRPACEADQDG